MKDVQKYYQLAIEASKIIEWLPEVILSQWQVETAHFTSNNFLKNNNIAGQTWQTYMPLSIKGSARPKGEGGFYIKYANPVDGYVNFIEKNPRYSKVKNFKTAEEQFKEIAKQGWATAPNYAKTLLSVHNSNIKKGIYKIDK